MAGGKIGSMVSRRLFVIVGLMVAISIGFLMAGSIGKNTKTENGQVREIAITAKRFSFTPDTITVKQGERIRLKITSEDVSHGFSILELGVNEVIEPGKETVVELTPTKKGSYRYFCSVECGNGHLAMQGKLVVE